jgi:HK97 family phage major capsid protein
MDTLSIERTNTLKHAQQIVDRAKSDRRELTPTEQAAVDADLARVDELDAARKSDNYLNRVAALGAKSGLWPVDSEGNPTSGNLFTQAGVEYLTLRSPSIKSDLAARFGRKLGTVGVKSLTEPGDPYTTIPMDSTVYREGDAPPALSEIIPAITRPVSFRYMRQTQRVNNAAPVAAGALKPTSLFGLTPYEGRLHVIAHVSEPIDKYQLQDGPSLLEFVRQEMVAGLQQAVETQIVSGDGTGEALTGLAATSGIQLQAFTTSPVLTARAAITKVQVLSYEPYSFVMNPTDWERVETTTLDAGQFVLNAEGSRSGVPVDSAARRLWGVPVTVSTAVPAGTGYLLSNGVVQLATDGALAIEQSSNVGDSFARNQVVLRVEGRFDLVVTRPMGVVQLDLTA